MDYGNFLSTAEMSEFKSIVDESFRVTLGSNFEGFHDSWINLMFDARKLSFSIFSHNCDIHIIMACLDVWMGEAQVDIGEKIQMLIKFVIIIVFSFYSLLRNHYSQQNTLVLLQGLPLLEIFKCKIF